MGFLDELLSGVKERRAAAKREMLNTETHVVGIGSKGVQFAVPDRRVSTMLAQNVVRELTGYVPDGMKYRGGADTFMPFAKGSNTADFLRQNDVKVGTTGTELQNVFERYQGSGNGGIGGNNNRSAAAATAQGFENRPNADDGSDAGALAPRGPVARRRAAEYLDTPAVGMEPAGVPTGASYEKDRSRTNMTGGYNQGYNGTRDTLLDMNQLDTFINSQRDLQQRVLHSALFGEF